MRFVRRQLAVAVLVGLLGTSCAYNYTTRQLVSDPPTTAESTTLTDASGRAITTLRIPENRRSVRLAEIPKTLQDAVVAIEDERFYLHKGFDLRGVIRAARNNLEAGGVSEGASTITQQYVGNVFLDRTDQSANRKLQEIALARQFEQQHTKEYILEQYLNWVYLGNGANGVQAAALAYFNKNVKELTLAESALLAGLIQLPSKLDPFTNPAAAEKRRNAVLDRMLANAWISDADYLNAISTPLALKPYVPITEETYPAAHFVEEVKKWFLANPTFGATEQAREKLLFEGGLRITTTLDLDLQAKAEAARDAVLPDNGKNPDASIVVMNPDNGAILAMVGGRNFFGTAAWAKVNLAAGGGRQTGSSIKAVGLAAALSSGWEATRTYPAPSSITLDIPGSTTPWNVKGGGDGSDTSLIDATIHSYNTVFAQLSLDMGPQKLVDMAKKMGIASPIDPVPASILGTSNVTMLDMAQAFSVFADRGVRVDHSYVTRIVRADGTVLYEHKTTSQKVLEASVADQISWILNRGVNEGTGTAARIPGHHVAGKTGTAENAADATFIGFTPQRVAAVWVGYPEGQIPMEPPRTPITVFGGSYPAQIFQKTMSAALEQLPDEDFPTPPPSSAPTTTEPLNAEQATVPSVVGSKTDDAKAALGTARFNAATVLIESDEFAPGTVIAQSPRPGSQAAVGSTVNLEVAKAPSAKAATVPNVVGMTSPQAIAALQAGGFTVVQIIEPAKSQPPPTANTVWQQLPAAASTRPSDGRITISVQP
jgi:penicillin-binding protein 1A